METTIMGYIGVIGSGRKDLKCKLMITPSGLGFRV